jgi:hypothetical protein
VTLDEARSSRPRRPPGLLESIRSTREAGMRLAMAHVDLAKAEIAAIGGQIARVAALAGIAIAVVMLAGILAVVGTSLFLGEWLLGSMGWGVLHGILLFAAVAMACVLAALGVPGSRLGQALALGLVVAVVVGVGLALALPNRAYRSIGENVLPNVEAGVRPLVVGLIVVGLLGLLIGIVGAVRASGNGFRGGSIIGGAIAGALIGAISAIDTGVQVGVGIGIAAGYVVWILAMGMDIARRGVDVDELKRRFYPTETIETSKETLAWLQSKMPPGIGS